MWHCCRAELRGIHASSDPEVVVFERMIFATEQPSAIESFEDHASRAVLDT